MPAFAAAILLGGAFTPSPAAEVSLTITWEDATPDDHSGFKVERKTESGGTFAALTDVAAANRAYVDWTVATGSTYCYRVAAYNEAGSSPYTPEACVLVPTAVLRTLSVAKAGTGAGTVDSSPIGIACGLDCSEEYVGGTSVALSATAAAGSTFTGWSGACSGTGSCVVTMDAAKSVAAAFALPTFSLSVVTSGTGSGTVVSSLGGIDCGSACASSYPTGTSITLTATPAAGSTFAGWSGACSGTGTCPVAMTGTKVVTATFTLAAVTLAVSPVPANGRITGAGIDCGVGGTGACATTQPTGTTATLTATPEPTYEVKAWTGCTVVEGSVCQVALTSAKTVAVTFQKPTVSVAATINTAKEANLVPGIFTFTRTGSVAKSLTVPFLVSGTATSNVDYVSLGSSVTFPAGVSAVRLSVVPLQDSLLERDETIIVSLARSTAYGVAGSGGATMKLVSDEVKKR